MSVNWQSANIVTAGFGTLGQVDLIDFQSMPDHGCNFLLNYIDHRKKAIVLCATLKAGIMSCICFVSDQHGDRPSNDIAI